MKDKLMAIVPGLIAGIVGGAAGAWLFEAIVKQGFYALVIPGALAGFLCGIVSGGDSNVRGVLNSLVALASSLVAEWRSFAFKADDSLGYFLAHAHQLKPITLAMIGIGTFLGFWWGRERIRPRGRKPDAGTNALE